MPVAHHHMSDDGKGLAQSTVDVQYPALVALVTDREGAWDQIEGCCFHDLLCADDHELSGMGLAIIGNLCKLLARGAISPMADAALHLRVAAGAPEIVCPWPGMPDSRPLPLDLTQMPFDATMFLTGDQFTHRVNRLALMRRIEDVWVPWLKKTLWEKL